MCCKLDTHVGEVDLWETTSREEDVHERQWDDVDGIVLEVGVAIGLEYKQCSG